MQLIDRQFAPSHFVGGHVALDLANTVAARDPDRGWSARGGAPGRDYLPRYDSVLAWGAAMAAAGEGVAPILDADELAALAARARRAPAEAATALAALKRLREAVFAVAAALARDGAPPAGALEALRASWLDAAAAARLTGAAGAITLGFTVAGSGLDLPRHRVAWAAMELLTSVDPARLRLCDGDGCAWLFLDRSKAGRRRWCDMATCGNVAKARRHYARQRAG